MKKIIYVFATLTVFVFLNSCKGPAGETGPIGPTGAAGATGSTGVKGDPGSVNVISTGWLKITKELYAKGYAAQNSVFYTGVSVSGGTGLEKISQKTLDEGIILAYNRLPGSSDIYLVPFDYYDGTLHLTYSFNIQPKTANFYVYFSKAIDPKTYFVDEEYRVIIIQGANGGRLKNIDLKNYDAVIKALNISRE